MGRRVLDTVVEVSDVFPPLKSVAAGLKVIVNNFEVGDRFPASVSTNA